MTDSNFRTYVADTYALVVQTPNPLNSLSLRRQFRLTIMRTIRNLQPAFDGVPI